MPNWCDNIITITAVDADVLQLAINTMRGDDNRILSFSAIYPPPESVSDEDMLAWQRGAWGCKWDIVNDDLTDDWERSQSLDTEGQPFYMISACFQTAWSPPTGVFAELATRYPALRINLRYCETGACFAGYTEWEDGSLCDEEYTKDRDEVQSYSVDWFGAEPWDEDEEGDEDDTESEAVTTTSHEDSSHEQA